jgi:hypothetical protein
MGADLLGWAEAGFLAEHIAAQRSTIVGDCRPTRVACGSDFALREPERATGERGSAVHSGALGCGYADPEKTDDTELWGGGHLARDHGQGGSSGADGDRHAYSSGQVPGAVMWPAAA